MFLVKNVYAEFCATLARDTQTGLTPTFCFSLVLSEKSSISSKELSFCAEPKERTKCFVSEAPVTDSSVFTRSAAYKSLVTEEVKADPQPLTLSSRSPDLCCRFWKTELPFDEMEKKLAGLKTLTINETNIEDNSVEDSGTELLDGPEVSLSTSSHL